MAPPLRLLTPVLLAAGLCIACEGPGNAPRADAPDAPGSAPSSASTDTSADASAAAGDPSPDAPPAAPTVQVWFSRGEAPEPVTREVRRADPAAALGALTAGPTAAERRHGLTSWFSDSTAGALRTVTLRDGLLIVDFAGLDRLIPGAGSSAGSGQLLAVLDATVFQFTEVDSVEYRLDGRCERFWEWLQRECTTVRRP